MPFRHIGAHKTARLACRLAFVLITSACATGNPELFPPREGDDTVDVWVVNHRWHTGIAVKRTDLSEGSLVELASFDRYPYAEIGWGERDFYMDAGDSVWLGIKAMLWANDSVMHVVGLDKSPELYFKNSKVARLTLTRRGFDAMTRHVDKSFERVAGTPAKPLKKGLYGPSYFYPATGTFWLFNVCNNWTASALKTTGIPIATWYVFTSDQVLDQVDDVKSESWR